MRKRQRPHGSPCLRFPMLRPRPHAQAPKAPRFPMPPVPHAPAPPPITPPCARKRQDPRFPIRLGRLFESTEQSINRPLWRVPFPMRSKPTQAAKPHIPKPPYSEFPALRISPHPKNSHRETHLCDMSWCAAGPIGPAEGPPPAMAGGGRVVPGNGLARGVVPAMAGTETGAA